MSEETMKTEEFPPESAELLRNLFKGELAAGGFARFGADEQVLPAGLRARLAPLRFLTVRPDDVWVCTFPRSGTTMTQEIVWLLQNNFDYETASKVVLDHRSYFIEFSGFMQDKAKMHGIDLGSVKSPDELPSPRVLKTHLSPSLLPPARRVVYVARDPRDVAVSFYHHNRRFAALSYTGDFKTFFQLFMKDLVLYSPYFPHVKQAWEQRNHPNMLFIFYEEIIKDLESTIRRIAKFLGKECSEEDIRRLASHMQFDNFKNNKAVNREYVTKLELADASAEPFIRKGVAGGWREHFDADMARQAQEWMQRNLQDTDLRFPDT